MNGHSNSSGLIIRGLSKFFGDFIALANVSVELPPGQLLVALGPSGCGKTTLLRLIAGLEAPDEGEIKLGGRRIDTLPPAQRDVSLVFQNYALYPHMTVAENLSFPLKVRKVPTDQRRTQVNEIAELLDLTDQLGKKPGQLSGGQRQRVALGRAIIRKPNLYLLDEPLSNLDSELRARMRREIVRLQKSLNTAAVYVTHDQTEALTMADIIMVLHKGHVRQIGTPDEIYRAPADTFVAGFIGAPQMNFLHCRYRSDSLGRSAVHPFNMPFEALYPRARGAVFSDNEQFILGVRPEAIVVGPIGEHKGRVKNVEFLGDRRVATMFFKDSELTFFTDSKSLAPGAEISFNLKKDSLHFFNATTGRRLEL
ncbi:MAG TPA: ABC transporter ATP-binding protein [candidate division Zixibacteria bacterium]|nr:ABC transporter ATP-binding protein [candidate division Zixibacteria bacterium]